ncbi:MAG: RNA methyltransferase [Deltaproteobacteria bacterium]|nr:RNA methyltransferase [Deltaproteobacteria bacterium]
MGLYVSLLHYPVYDKNNRTIASAITTTDIHDISRLARTYGLKRFYVVTPLEDQRELAGRILRHWRDGFGASYNPHRKEALELVSIVSCLEEAVRDIERVEGEPPILVATDASWQEGNRLDYEKAREIVSGEKTILLVLGTAWGLDRTIIRGSDYVLDPIEGGTDYNHLSVRTAAAIILDRIAGRDWKM